MAFLPAQLQNFSLSGSGVSISDTTMTLSSFKTIDGVNLSMADFGGTRGYMTIEPGSRSREEQISFSGITQNANGTATLTGINTVLFLSPYTETSAFSKSHPGGVVAVITNTSGFYNKFTAKPNNETITGLWSVPDPVNGPNIANRQWVLSVVNGGAVSVDSVVVAGDAGETVVAGQVLYFKESDGLWWKASSAASATSEDVMLGIAQGAGTASNPVTDGILIRGVDTNQLGLVAGTAMYLSTGGAIATTPGTFSKVVGQAASATSLYFDPEYFYVVTGLQKEALVGNGGTPSSSNTYVTEDGLDTVLAGAIKFGGTGADGALSINSGATNIDLAGESQVTKNYTSISITGTGSLTFTNPHLSGTVVSLKSQGNVTITSTANPAIDLRGIGGGDRNPGASFTGGPGAGATAQASSATAGIIGYGTHLITSNTMGKMINVYAGGGGGAGNNPGGGAGGRGGGGLYIECDGALNITGTINANGSDGANGGNNGGSFSNNWSGGGGASSEDGTPGTNNGTSATGSGGGGGGAGSIVILYTTFTADSGTYSLVGGAGGTGTSTGGTGAAGYYMVALNTSFF